MLSVLTFAGVLGTLVSPGSGDHSFYRPSYPTTTPESSYYKPTPEPSYYKPEPKPEPSYYKPQPKPTQQNCSVEDEVLDAEICTPGKNPIHICFAMGN